MDEVAVDSACLKTFKHGQYLRNCAQRASADKTVLYYLTGTAFYTGNKNFIDACRVENPTPMPVDEPRAQTAPITAYDGSAVWALIHDELEPTREKLDAAIASITCLGCRNHAKRLIVKCPPIFAPLQAYREWSVDFHDDVNESMTKPRFGWANAANKYHWQG